jgi:hypothetical protein
MIIIVDVKEHFCREQNNIEWMLKVYCHPFHTQLYYL